ncbi:Protein kinase domain [Macleaya cordata]|uniref:RING-type E3 ubiquitin transferase n=1 Tax=Macleaya cordata TaxID=56857 RepID=A0A200Q1Z0_MACCD|nr:Protein kinase domain [Macleaya cordata]
MASICSDDRSIASSTSTVVAVAVRGSSRSSRRAFRWAVDNLMTHGDRFVLIHVIPPITSIPTPSGSRIPIKQMDANVVATYRKDMKSKCEEIFLPFKALCKTKEMESLVLEDENPSYALLRYISESGCNNLVLGSSSSNFITRKLKGRDIASTLLKFVTNTCNIYVVSRNKLIKKLANPSSSAETSAGNSMHTLTEYRESSSTSGEHIYTLHSRTTSEASSEVSDLFGRGYTNRDSFASSVVEDNQGGNHVFMTSFKDAKQSKFQAELEGLQLELRTTLDMYDRACEDLVHIQKKVQALSSECIEEARRVRAVMEREEMWRKTAAEEKCKHLEAMKELEVAKELLAKEVHERQRAELSALTKSSERQKLIDALFSEDKRYRRYTRDEIEVATDFFCETKKIGEGAYGKVYKCSLDHTPVAVKVLQPDESDKTKKEEFLREVEVLSQLRHPHLVLLLGACPEIGCLVYEYMENGSLEERLFCKEGTEPLPWFIRFQIAFDVACGLTFLHGSEPEPIIHRDLKPGNILLDRNYVSKIGDVGLAKFMSSVVPDNVTEYRNSTLAGTLSYMDPEYYRTGTLRPKSDVYAFGIIILQLLTARHPNGLVVSVENAINNGSFGDILDKSISDCPIVEAEELAWIALHCSKLRCRDRPDLKSEVLPVLEKLSSLASVQLQKGNIYTPSYYFCPILQEVMDDPHIAADGFTYEYAAIKAWLEKQKVSPVTRLMLPHTVLTPNHTLRSAIQEWKQHVPRS